MAETTGSARIEINASPSHVWAILTDLARINEISPEVYKARWNDDATGPIPGATFTGSNEIDGNKWDLSCLVLAADPGRTWTFRVPAVGDPAMVWSYAIEETATGCVVVESFDAPMLADEQFVKTKRHAGLVENIEQSLANLKYVAES